VLVVGAGAVGGYFGAHLARAGRDVTFLLRPSRAAVVRAEGLTVRTPGESFTVHPAVATAEELVGLGAFDIVLLAVKSVGFEAAIDDLAPAVGSDTLVIPLLNGMRHLDVLRARFGDERVLGGYAFISVQLEGDDVVQLFGDARIAYGRLDGPRPDEVLAVLEGAEFTAKRSTAIELEMWEKWTMLASAGAVTCLFRGDVGAIVAAGGAQYGEDAVREIAAIAAASGFPPRDHVVDSSIARLQEAGSPFTTSLYRDLVQGLDVESEHIIGDLVDRARGFGIATPVFDAALVALRVYRATR
jgi:2-dehydropantoate 2-reductase